MFVVVLGAAPSIANGLIHGVDHIPPLLLRAGRVLGREGLLVLPPRRPAGRPAVVHGRAQAGLGLRLAQPDGRRAARRHRQEQSLGFLLASNRDLLDAPGLMATMIVILVIGILVDALFFSQIEKRLRRRWGLDQA